MSLSVYLLVLFSRFGPLLSINDLPPLNCLSTIGFLSLSACPSVYVSFSLPLIDLLDVDHVGFGAPSVEALHVRQRRYRSYQLQLQLLGASGEIVVR